MDRSDRSVFGEQFSYAPVLQPPTGGHGRAARRLVQQSLCGQIMERLDRIETRLLQNLPPPPPPSGVPPPGFSIEDLARNLFTINMAMQQMVLRQTHSDLVLSNLQAGFQNLHSSLESIQNALRCSRAASSDTSFLAWCSCTPLGNNDNMDSCAPIPKDFGTASAASENPVRVPFWQTSLTRDIGNSTAERCYESYDLTAAGDHETIAEQEQRKRVLDYLLSSVGDSENCDHKNCINDPHVDDHFGKNYNDNNHNDDHNDDQNDHDYAQIDHTGIGFNDNDNYDDNDYKDNDHTVNDKDHHNDHIGTDHNVNDKDHNDYSDNKHNENDIDPHSNHNAIDNNDHDKGHSDKDCRHPSATSAAINEHITTDDDALSKIDFLDRDAYPSGGFEPRVFIRIVELNGWTKIWQLRTERELTMEGLKDTPTVNGKISCDFALQEFLYCYVANLLSTSTAFDAAKFALGCTCLFQWYQKETDASSDGIPLDCVLEVIRTFSLGATFESHFGMPLSREAVSGNLTWMSDGTVVNEESFAGFFALIGDAYAKNLVEHDLRVDNVARPQQLAEVQFFLDPAIADSVKKDPNAVNKHASHKRKHKKKR